MKKSIKVLSYISMGILVASVGAVLLALVFRETLLQYIYWYEDLAVVLPLGGVVSLVLRLGAVGLLCFCAGERRFGIWVEILIASVLAAAVPFLRWLLSLLQTTVLGRVMGNDYMLALGGIDLLWNYATCLTGVAVALALLVCGMSLADKLLGKKNS